MRNTHLLILVPVSLVVFGAAGAAELPAALRDCRAMTSAEARLDCYDRLVDTHKAMSTAETAAPVETSTGQAAVTPQASPGHAAAPSGASSEPTATQIELFGKNKGEIQDVLIATGIKELDQIEATIASVRKMTNGRTVITLDNGQVWLQTDNRRVRLSEDDRIVIERGSFGSYNMRMDETVVRVKRIS